MPDELASGPTADELHRLRALVGPSEEAYAELAEDVIRSQGVARNALLETGRLRGRIVELERELAQARRDADRVRRRSGTSGAARMRDLAGEAWSEVLRPSLGRVLRRIRRR